MGCLAALVIGQGLAAVTPSSSAAPAMPPLPAVKPLRNMLIVNEDNSHFFSSRTAAEMTVEGVQAMVDRYAGGAVTHFFLSPNSMRASFRSRTREAIWDPVDGVEPDGLWPQNARRLDQAGIDPYAIWIVRCRAQGISPWISMRMNDVHGVNEPENFMHSTFWRSHPEFRRVPGGSATPWVNQALNYVHPEVREHNLAFVRELLERYDPDGLELDWMRFGFHLTPGREAEERGVLSAFMREVRALTQAWAVRRGHPIRLGVRVPAHPDAASGLGMDAVAWAKEGWVDLIVPCPFWSTSDFDIPMELWRERLGEVSDRTAVVPGFEHNLRAWPTGKSIANDLATLRGFAASARHRGADSLYLFNWMDSQTRPVGEEEYHGLIRDGLSDAAMAGLPRRHPVTYRDTVPADFPRGVQLPVEGLEGGTFRVWVGPRTGVDRVSVVVGLAARDGIQAAGFEALLNGQTVGPVVELKDLSGLSDTARAWRFPCPVGALRDGLNEFSVRQISGTVSQQIVWAELRVNEPPALRP